MRMKCLLPLLAFLLLLSCDRSPLDGAKRIAPGTYWKLQVLGEGARHPNDSDSVLVRVRIARLGEEPGSLFSTERWFGMDHDAAPIFERLRTGDSASLAMEAARVPWTALGAVAPTMKVDSPWVALELGLRGIRSHAESREVAAALLASRDHAHEDSTLARFFQASTVPWRNYGEVRYTIDGARGKGAPVRSGQLVTFHYTARFLDTGRVFDDTRKGGAPITWRLGDPEQVMKGLEIAAHLMRLGDQGRFVFPSAVAFGPRGSSSGIIPPWTPVLYDIEVVGVE